MTEVQRRAILCMYPDAEAARLMGLSRERARQLRKEYDLMFTTEESNDWYIERQAQQYYLDFMLQDPDLTDPRRCKSIEWKRAKEFADNRCLPWPPPNASSELEQSLGFHIWKYARSKRDETWEEIGAHFSVANACSIAGIFAKKHGYEWPLKGGKDWSKE